MFLIVVNEGLPGMMAGGLARPILGAIVGIAIGEFVLRVLLPIGQGGSEKQFLELIFAVIGWPSFVNIVCGSGQWKFFENGVQTGIGFDAVVVDRITAIIEVKNQG